MADDLKRFPCKQCGAQLAFSPGAQSLKCTYCGFLNEIPQSQEQIEELDFRAYLDIARQESTEETEKVVKCSACAAEFTVGGRTVSDTCPFCGSHSIIPVEPEVRIRPKSLLPFAIDAKQCREIYRKWISSRWLAPNALKEFARADGAIDGMYIPYWTYDTYATTWYTGMRGDHYYETEHYTDSDGNRQTRQVRKTRWTPAAGTVWRNFDDVIVQGSTTLAAKHAQRIQNWDIGNLVPYQEAYMSGFRTERYNIGLEQGFHNAQEIMNDVIRGDIRVDIGGDEQQIATMNTQWDNITFKHVLVPTYLGAYRFKGKTFGFLINGRTGAISGDAPVSVWKVLLIVVAVLIVIGLFIVLTNR